MNSSDGKTLELVYGDKKLADLIYDANTNALHLKQDISHKFNLNKEKVNLYYNKMELDDTTVLSSILITDLGKISGEKIKVRVIPQITMKLIQEDFIISQIDNDQHRYNFTYDVINTTVEVFKREVLAFFKEKMGEFNYNLEYCEIYEDPDLEEKSFVSDEDKLFNLGTYQLNFLIKNKSINLYKNHHNHNHTKDISDNCVPSGTSIELRKNVSSGELFQIIIQTYNQDLFELEVYPDMSIGVLRKNIEDKFKIKKEYQELIYIIYKLNDDSKFLKDYYIRPNCTIFLRGFYFPLFFIDFYNKTNTNIIRLNAAKQVSELKKEVMRRLNLDIGDFKLICNGKELDEMISLVDYNIQKLQVIYIK